MHDVIYVSNEQELEKSLPGNHKVTIFNADYDVGIFKKFNIEYRFNETPESDCYYFFSLQHAFHPYKGINVIYGTPLYMSLLNKVLEFNHSVAFVLALDNVNDNLLRLCQCFIGAASNSLHMQDTSDGDSEMDQTLSDFWFGQEELDMSPNIIDESKNWSPIPYVIGKAKIEKFVPVWSFFWDVNIQTLDALFINVFRREFCEGFTYSKEGLDQLRALLENRTAEITGGKKLRLYPFDFYTQPYHCLQSIEGPREMLDTSLVEKIKSLAVEASKVLREYEIKDQKPVLPNNALPGKGIAPQRPVGQMQTQSLSPNDPYGLFRNSAGCEESGRYNVDSGVRLLIDMVFDYSRVEDPQKELKTFYADAAGELATPTAIAIGKRLVENKDDYCSDGMGNLHSFADKITAKSWIAVWPHGEKELMTKLCGAEETENYYKSPAINNSVPSSSSSTAGGTNKIQKQVIDIVFESFDKDMRITCTIDKKPPRQRPNLDKGALRFLAFNAGDKSGYFFAFKDTKDKKDKKMVLLINDEQDKKKALRINDRLYQKKIPMKNTLHDVKVLTRLFNVINITSATPLMFNPFLPPGYAQGLGNENDAHIPGIRAKELTKFLFMKNEQYPKLDYNGDLLSIAELQEDIKFNILLSPEFKKSLTELPEYKKNNEYKIIIDFIIETFLEPQSISDAPDSESGAISKITSP